MIQHLCIEAWIAGHVPMSLVNLLRKDVVELHPEPSTSASFQSTSEQTTTSHPLTPYLKPFPDLTDHYGVTKEGPPQDHSTSPPPGLIASPSSSLEKLSRGEFITLKNAC
jgi:hypothetical protein